MNIWQKLKNIFKHQNGIDWKNDVYVEDDKVKQIATFRNKKNGKLLFRIGYFTDEQIKKMRGENE